MSKHYTFIDSLDIEDSVKRSLSQVLGRIEAGSDTVFTTPLVNSRKPDKILSGWDDIYKAKSDLINHDLNALEQSNRDKYGPRSIAAPWSSRKEDVLNSFTKEENIILPDLSTIKPPRPGLRPISIETAIKFVKNNTNSGLPYFTRRGQLKGIYLVNLPDLQNRKDACVLFTRTQESMKTRTVWGFPMMDTILELLFYRPLLLFQKKLKWRSALSGPSDIDSRITYLIDEAQSRKFALLSIDFSQYDASVKTTLQKFAFDYIKHLFRPHYGVEIDELRDRFNTIGLITPDGIWEGPHGVPSGSTFTNEVDSIAQFLLGKSFYEQNLGMHEELFDVQGDDGAYVLPWDSVDDLKQTFSKAGLAVNNDKSYVTKDHFVYLQNLYHAEYRSADGIIRGIYPTYRALNRLVYPERFTSFEEDGISGQDYFSLRAISILENCKNHPLHRELVKYIYSIDKYKLDYSGNGLVKFIKRVEQSRGTQGLFINQYGDDVRGLGQFETVKILSEL